VRGFVAARASWRTTAGSGGVGGEVGVEVGVSEVGRLERTALNGRGVGARTSRGTPARRGVRKSILADIVVLQLCNSRGWRGSNSSNVLNYLMMYQHPCMLHD
jgi:hypothetical protein